jgi:hypothetical protein
MVDADAPCCVLHLGSNALGTRGKGVTSALRQMPPPVSGSTPCDRVLLGRGARSDEDLALSFAGWHIFVRV